MEPPVEWKKALNEMTFGEKAQCCDGDQGAQGGEAPLQRAWREMVEEQAPPPTPGA